MIPSQSWNMELTPFPILINIFGSTDPASNQSQTTMGPFNSILSAGNGLCRCCCNIYACWPCVTATSTTASQTCLLDEGCCKIDACWTTAIQSACLPIFCHSTLHVCWRCAFLSAIPASMMCYYQPCLLVWCLTIGHVFWCGASLSAVSTGVVSHYRTCLLVVVPHCQQCRLVWCLTICHAFWSGASL